MRDHLGIQLEELKTLLKEDPNHEGREEAREAFAFQSAACIHVDHKNEDGIFEVKVQPGTYYLHPEDQDDFIMDCKDSYWYKDHQNAQLMKLMKEVPMVDLGDEEKCTISSTKYATVVLVCTKAAKTELVFVY